MSVEGFVAMNRTAAGEAELPRELLEALYENVTGCDLQVRARYAFGALLIHLPFFGGLQMRSVANRGALPPALTIPSPPLALSPPPSQVEERSQAEVVKEGWLLKQNRRVGWKWRYCLLSSRALYIFKQKEDATPAFFYPLEYSAISQVRRLRCCCCRFRCLRCSCRCGCRCCRCCRRRRCCRRCRCRCR